MGPQSSAPSNDADYQSVVTGRADAVSHRVADSLNTSPQDYAISTPLREPVRRNHGVSCDAVCGLATAVEACKVLKTLMVQAFSTGAGCRLKIARSPVQPRDCPLKNALFSSTFDPLPGWLREAGRCHFSPFTALFDPFHCPFTALSLPRFPSLALPTELTAPFVKEL